VAWRLNADYDPCVKRVAIVQARMSSSRLPGKVLMELAGRPMLAQQIRRLRACYMLDEISIATTTDSVDDVIVQLARTEGVRWFRGSEADVLGRYVGAAQEAGADIIVRVTADCPLLAPEVTDAVVRELADAAATSDYASNVVERTYPRGLDSEAFFMDTLLRIGRLARAAPDREHVTLFVRATCPQLFLTRNVVDVQNNSDLRWTVDTEVDLQVVRAFYEGLGLGERIAPYAELLAFARANPALARLNLHVETWSP
jgi:spore coat polysaccharide biosynthesis protein SpsF